MEEKPVLLILTFPDAPEIRIRCDSVRFSVPDSADGKVLGGSVGIRRGHADALMAAAEGDVTAFSDGEEIFRRRIGGGMAVVSRNEVTLLARRSEGEAADDGADEESDAETGSRE